MLTSEEKNTAVKYMTFGIFSGSQKSDTQCVLLIKMSATSEGYEKN